LVIEIAISIRQRRNFWLFTVFGGRILLRFRFLIPLHCINRPGLRRLTFWLPRERTTGKFLADFWLVDPTIVGHWRRARHHTDLVAARIIS